MINWQDVSVFLCAPPCLRGKKNRGREFTEDHSDLSCGYGCRKSAPPFRQTRSIIFTFVHYGYYSNGDTSLAAFSPTCLYHGRICHCCASIFPASFMSS